MEINKIMQEIHKNAINKGFWEDKETKNMGEVLMLCVSELSEALEAHRKQHYSVPLHNLQSRLSEIKKSMPKEDLDYEKTVYKAAFELHVKNSFEDEIADTVIRLFDLCAGFNIDLVSHIQHKLEYNKLREYKHGKSY
jgi:NTP pyrophosphatase (non-canonical NTP hydrolase)